ncbi:ammonium transporter [Nocardia sp. NPDC003482]|uniref:ammonium transporter n=1 Tax=Nocardia sp. NPDC004068 TaxID=3364303 RepID=UPI0036CE10AB
MNLHKLTAAVAPAVVTVALGAGTVHADPGAPETVRYEAKLVGNVVETTLDGGTFAVSDDQRTVAIQDKAGAAVVVLPLSFRQDGKEYPLPFQVRDSGRVLDLTAVKNEAAARPAPATPVASNAENQQAMEAFATQFGIATAVGGFIGTAIGAVVGAIIGLAVLPVDPVLIITGAGIGGIIGTLVVGGPALIVAGIDLINTLTAPPGTTKWMDTTGRR